MRNALLFRAVLALCLIWQGVAGLPARAMPSGPTVTAVICGEGGAREVVIDLATGAPVEAMPDVACCETCGPCVLCVAVLAGLPSAISPAGIGLRAQAPIVATHRDARRAETPRARAPPLV